MAEMRTLLRRLGASGHTVLVSGHPLGEAMFVAVLAVLIRRRDVA